MVIHVQSSSFNRLLSLSIEIFERPDCGRQQKQLVIYCVVEPVRYVVLLRQSIDRYLHNLL